MTYLVIETERGLMSCAVRNFTECLNVVEVYRPLIDLSEATFRVVVAESGAHRNSLLDKEKVA